MSLIMLRDQGGTTILYFGITLNKTENHLKAHVEDESEAAVSCLGF